MHFWGVFEKDEFRIQGTSRDRWLFMAGGGTEEKRVGYKTKFWVSKRLGKWKAIQGLGNKKIFSFSKHDSFKYWRLKSNVNSHMSIQCLNQSESSSFSDLSGGKCCFQRKYMCRQHEILHCRKLYKQLSNSCHRSGKGHVWQLNGILFGNVTTAFLN